MIEIVIIIMITVIYHYPYHKMIAAGSEASGTCPGGVHDIWVADRKGVHNVKERSCDNKLILRVGIFYI